VVKIRCSRSFSTRVDPTPHVQACAAMFGLGIDEDLQITLYNDVPVELGAGRIIYITGESGAGKSCLLSDIRNAAAKDTSLMLMEVAQTWPAKPLVDQFGDWSLNQAAELLAATGLSEAFVMLREPAQLSDGQRYRFMLAMSIYEARTIAAACANAGEERTVVICIDEFLAFLDRTTARNVAHQTRRVATKHGLCFVVATTHEDIDHDLQANTKITLRLTQKPEYQTNATGV